MTRPAVQLEGELREKFIEEITQKYNRFADGRPEHLALSILLKRWSNADRNPLRAADIYQDFLDLRKEPELTQPTIEFVDSMVRISFSQFALSAPPSLGSEDRLR